MVDIQRIAEVMGGRPILRRQVRSLRALSEAVDQGLPKAALRTTIERVLLTPGERRRFLYRIVPEGTYKRRRNRLSPAESEGTERLARMIATAEYVWDHRENARRFLTTPHSMLDGRSPLEMGMTELGARQVEELLDAIFYGLPA